MKKNQAAVSSPSTGSYRIAAVAILTGIPAATIRIWERRYAVVRPERSAGNVRLYAQADIERLALVKAAVDAGHSISTVAALDADQLHQRVQALPHREVTGRVGRVGVYGDALGSLLCAAWKTRRDILLTVHSFADALADPARATVADVTIIEVPSLQQLAIEDLRRLRRATQSRVTLVVYGLGGYKSLASLDREGVIALPAPVSAAHLARICLLTLAAGAGGTAEATPPIRSMAPRRYDDAQLVAINQMPNAIGCECPNHLSDLLIRLNGFEQYNFQCEDLNADDASLHVMMANASARCRELLEHALACALEHDGSGNAKPTRSSGNQ